MRRAHIKVKARFAAPYPFAPLRRRRG